MRGLRCLEARYRYVLAQLGYEYPPYYMVITEGAVLALTLGAAIPRLIEGPQGVQWICLVLATGLSLLHVALTPIRPHRVWMTGHSIVTLTVICLFWAVPATLDVVPLMAVLGVTQIAAVSTARVTAVHLAVFVLAIAVAGLFGTVHQAWLVALTTTFGAAVGLLLQNQLLLLRAERAAQESRLALDRAAIAGEVHDVVAHSLAVVLLNVTAARRSLESDDDRDEAVDALRDAETQGRNAMKDIRQTITLLRTDGPEAAQPDLDDITELVATFERAGMSVHLRVAPQPGPIRANVGLAAFRLVQESLANAVKHAPGARVEVSVTPTGDDHDGLVVRVSCPAPENAGRRSGGSGLAGMRARVETAGGALTVGPTDGMWLVEATFPTATEGVR